MGKRGKPSLAQARPDLAAQWHPEKNGDLTPDDVAPGSALDVWWLLRYDDSETGQSFDFEWRSQVRLRAEKGYGCPFLSGKALWSGFNDLATKRPDLAAEWHPTKNGDLTPSDVTPGSGTRVWWLFPYDDPETGKHFDFEWQASPNDRIHYGTGCPFLSETNPKVWPGFNDLATKRPDVAAEWHPTKNGDLTPDMVSCGSKKEVWWLLPYDDPETGNHFDFEWSATPQTRCLQGSGCPYLTGNAVWSGFNDLATKNPELAKQWHPTKNRGLTPEQVTCGSDEVVWWLLPYDDPITGKHLDFEWSASVTSRNGGTGCPFLSGRDVWPGYNDLATRDPSVAEEWHPSKNGMRLPSAVYVYSRERRWWKCGTCGHEWKMRVRSRTKIGSGCPECLKRSRRTGYDFWNN